MSAAEEAALGKDPSALYVLADCVVCPNVENECGIEQDAFAPMKLRYC